MIDYTFSMQDLEYFLLILTRVSCFVFILPFFNSTNVPRRIKAGLSFFIALILFYVLTPHVMPEYSTVLGYAILVLKEGITGLLIGFGASICNSIVLLAGKIADMEVGLSMVQMFDPMTREQSGFTGTLYQYSVLLMMMVTNLHHYFFRALSDTYQLVPVGMAHIDFEKLMTVMLQFVTDYILISFRICMPIIAAMLILNCMLGVLAKVAPQVNMFSVGIQIKLLVGLSVLYLSIVMLPNISSYIYEEMKLMMTAMTRSMY